ncbi:lactate dehydrogenase, partial [Turicibacter sanguinis]|nr:lactate dehydrogenase [Turicibacter sanguinis]
IKGVNYHMINEEFIAKMKDGAILINTARGEIQDIDAIIKAVESNKLGGFGTDVLEGESAVFFKDFKGAALENPSFQKLIDLYPRILVTPHIGSYTDEALTNMIEYSYENLRDYLNEGTCKNSIA